MFEASASGSVSHNYGSEDPDPNLDPYQNVTDPEHCGLTLSLNVICTPFSNKALSCKTQTIF